VPQVRAGFAAARCALRAASNPARWGTLHSVLLLHGSKPGADFGFLLRDAGSRTARELNDALEFWTADGDATAPDWFRDVYS
jgi:hypothetical protein